MVLPLVESFAVSSLAGEISGSIKIKVGGVMGSARHGYHPQLLHRDEAEGAADLTPPGMHRHLG